MFLNNYRRKFPLVNSSVIKKIYRRVCSASKSVGNIITDGQKITDKRLTDGNFVGKLITDGICVLRRRKNSVGKTVKSCSEIPQQAQVFDFELLVEKDFKILDNSRRVTGNNNIIDIY